MGFPDKYKDQLDTPAYRAMIEKAERYAREDFQNAQDAGVIVFVEEELASEKKIQMDMFDRAIKRCENTVEGLNMTRVAACEENDWDEVLEFILNMKEKNVRRELTWNKLCKNRIEQIPDKE